MTEQYVEYEFYFTDSDYADKVTKLYNEIELQNKYISIKNKSLLTHKDVETEHISIRFRNSVNCDKPLNYRSEIKTTEDINRLICNAIKKLCIRAPVYNDRSPMAIVIYKLRDVNPDLVNDTRLTDMFSVTKDIILGAKGVNSANIQKYNISDSTAKLLALCVELNKLVNYPTREYLINYHITNKINKYGPQWYNFTSTIQQQCILNCIDRINEAFTDQITE
jgi:hypothetical protein